MKCKLNSNENLVVIEIPSQDEQGQEITTLGYYVDGRVSSYDYVINRLSPLRKDALIKYKKKVEKSNM